MIARSMARMNGLTAIDAMMAEPMSTPPAATSGRCRGASSTSMFSEITLARVSQTGRHTHTRRRWIFGRDANCALCVYRNQRTALEL